MKFAAEIVAAGFLAWICAGLAVTSFLFRRNRCHRSRAVADFNHWIATHPGMPIERMPADILNQRLFD
jgi:hypothetical protein